MSEACEKLYGPAAENMLGFYQAVERAMAQSKEYGGAWNLPSLEKIYTQRVIKRAAGYLDKASAATEDPTIQARIDQDRGMWDQVKAKAAKLRGPSKR